MCMQKCNVSWRNARKYNSGPKMKRKRAFFMMSPLFSRFFFNWSLKSLCFSTGMRPFWGFFGLSKARGLAKAKKGRRPVEKHKLWKLKLKNEAKKWTNHKCRLSFHLRVAILLTCIPPWIHFFTLYGQVWVDLTISCYLSIELARKKYPLG